LGRAPKLNVGCGFDYRHGYINVDLNAEHGPDLVADATWLEPIEDNSCGEVVAQDVLEHMPRAKGTTALYEWNRVLMPGGKLVLRIPSVPHLVGLMSDPRFQGLEEQQRLMQCLYGTQSYVGDFHLNGYTEVTLRHALADAGFKVETITIVDEWMFEAVARKVSHKAPDALLRVTSDVEFIEQAYRHLLKREADPGGLAYYVKILQGGIARESVLASLRASPEYTAAASA
jgi:predicted SAM-dependent methyltransferase